MTEKRKEYDVSDDVEEVDDHWLMTALMDIKRLGREVYRSGAAYFRAEAQVGTIEDVRRYTEDGPV